MGISDGRIYSLWGLMKQAPRVMVPVVRGTDVGDFGYAMKGNESYATDNSKILPAYELWNMGQTLIGERAQYRIKKRHIL